jgi:hypothetical protein
MDAGGNFVCESKLVQVLDTDLTGKTYCVFGQGTWLFADPGASAGVSANPHSARVDFISSTQAIVTDIYDPVASILIPSYTMDDSGDDLGIGVVTYTVVGNLLTATYFADGESQSDSFIMTADGQVFAGGYFERSVDGGVDWWETVMVVGVQADSCDGLTE